VYVAMMKARTTAWGLAHPASAEGQGIGSVPMLVHGDEAEGVSGFVRVCVSIARS
jgi:hypothetical protein